MRRLPFLNGIRAFEAAARAESFAKAADAAVQEASKTLRGITGADVISMSAVVENDRISVYRTTVNISFGLER